MLGAEQRNQEEIQMSSWDRVGRQRYICGCTILTTNPLQFIPMTPNPTPTLTLTVMVTGTHDNLEFLWNSYEVLYGTSFGLNV